MSTLQGFVVTTDVTFQNFLTFLWLFPDKNRIFLTKNKHVTYFPTSLRKNTIEITVTSTVSSSLQALHVKLLKFPPTFLQNVNFPLTVSWPVATLGLANWVHSHRKCQFNSENLFDQQDVVCLFIDYGKQVAFPTTRTSYFCQSENYMNQSFFLWQTEVMYEVKLTYA